MSPQIQNQTQSKRELPVENNFPLSSLLNISLIMSTLQDLCRDRQKQFKSVELNFVRYNPGISCMVCYRAAVIERPNGIADEIVFYAGTFAEGHYRSLADRLENQSWVPGTILASPQPVDNLRAIFYQFPNDSGLPALKLLAEPEKLMRLISGAINERRTAVKSAESNAAVFHRLRYKPENRFIARCEFNYFDGTPGIKKRKTILLRFEREKHSEKGFELSLKLYEALKANSRVNLPRPLFFIPEYNLQGFEWVEAAKFSELLRGSDPELWVKRGALVLSALHGCEVSGLPEHPASFHKERLRQMAEFLSHADEDIKKFSQEIANRLNSIAMREADFVAGLVHGDFHQGQLLVSDDRDYVLDLSRAYRGDSTADIGNFLAQLRYWHIIGRLKNIEALEQLFIEAYQSSRNAKVPEQRLKYWKTVGLFELAMRELRRIKPNWAVTCERVLQECQSTLDA